MAAVTSAIDSHGRMRKRAHCSGLSLNATYEPGREELEPGQVQLEEQEEQQQLPEQERRHRVERERDPVIA